MKNVLYIGPYTQNDTYGEISRGYIDAILVQHNLTTYPIYYNTNLIDANKFDKYEKKISNGKYDYIIQHCLPGDFFCNKTDATNIGIVNIETHDWTNNYESKSNMSSMDEIWVSSNYERQILIKSGISTNIKVVPPCINTNLTYQVDSMALPNVFENTYKFYCIITDPDKDNLEDLILAFNIAFNFTDNVSLIIKTDISDIENIIVDIKKKIGFKHKFKKEFIVKYNFGTNYAPLHNSCDCFVHCPNGSSFDPRLIEALTFGKTPIVNMNTSSADFVNNTTGTLVKSHKTPVVLTQRKLTADYDFYHSNQYWYKIDIYDLIQKMQNMYSDWKKNKPELIKKTELGKQELGTYTAIATSNKLCL